MHNKINSGRNYASQILVALKEANKFNCQLSIVN
jgi:hypothetical protein